MTAAAGKLILPKLAAAVGLLLGVLFFGRIGLLAHAMKCYQGQTQLNLSVGGSPTECPITSWSCIKSVDYSQGLVTRACQTTNCTQFSEMGALCANSTGFPPQTFCCCSSDGCNGSGPPPDSVAVAIVCSPNGTWGSWSAWSSCPSPPSSLATFNVQRRIRFCNAQPSGCKVTAPYNCSGPYAETLSCGGNSSSSSASPTGGQQALSGGGMSASMMQQMQISQQPAASNFSAAMAQAMQLNMSGNEVGGAKAGGGK